jgi:heat shock protein HtpX
MQFSFFGSMYGVGRDRNNGGAIIIVIAVAFITWIVSFLIIRAISRYREYSADRGAAQTTRKPASLANALLKITGKMDMVSQKDIKRVEGYNAFFIIPAISRGSLASLFSTHPPVESRIQKLMDMEKSMRGV